jgi:hypothetical protein
MPSGTPRTPWQTQALPMPQPEELFEQQDGFHHRTLAKGSKVSKIGRIDFRHQG